MTERRRLMIIKRKEWAKTKTKIYREVESVFGPHSYSKKKARWLILITKDWRRSEARHLTGDLADLRHYSIPQLKQFISYLKGEPCQEGVVYFFHKLIENIWIARHEPDLALYCKGYEFQRRYTQRAVASP